MSDNMGSLAVNHLKQRAINLSEQYCSREHELRHWRISLSPSLLLSFSPSLALSRPAPHLTFSLHLPLSLPLPLSPPLSPCLSLSLTAHILCWRKAGFKPRALRYKTDLALLNHYAVEFLWQVVGP
jgi:hypothetical protein